MVYPPALGRSIAIILIGPLAWLLPQQMSREVRLLFLLEDPALSPA